MRATTPHQLQDGHDGVEGFARDRTPLQHVLSILLLVKRKSIGSSATNDGPGLKFVHLRLAWSSADTPGALEQETAMRRLAPIVSLFAIPLLAATAIAHAPSVAETTTDSPAEAIVLDDPTLSRAIGATIDRPGEVDWYRMDLSAGDPLVVGMTAPDATGAVAATFTLMGPGLPDAAEAGSEAARLADAAGATGAIAFEPLADPPLEVHGGLGFVNLGTMRLEAPADGTYYVAVQALDPEATGKYVFAPGVREEFGADAIVGMRDLIAFFEAPWEPETVD